MIETHVFHHGSNREELKLGHYERQPVTANTQSLASGSKSDFLENPFQDSLIVGVKLSRNYSKFGRITTN